MSHDLQARHLTRARPSGVSERKCSPPHETLAQDTILETDLPTLLKEKEIVKRECETLAKSRIDLLSDRISLARDQALFERDRAALNKDQADLLRDKAALIRDRLALAREDKFSLLRDQKHSPKEGGPTSTDAFAHDEEHLAFINIDRRAIQQQMEAMEREREEMDKCWLKVKSDEAAAARARELAEQYAREFKERLQMLDERLDDSCFFGYDEESDGSGLDVSFLPIWPSLLV